MDKEAIKSELIKRFENISHSIKSNLPKSNEIFGAIKDLAERTKTGEDFTLRITDELNKIIAEKGMKLQGNEKQELIAYLKPEITKLIQKHIATK